jgi:VanZ family protein
VARRLIDEAIVATRPAAKQLGDHISVIRMFSNRLYASLPAFLWAVIIFYASTDTFSSQNTGQVLGAFLRSLYPAISQAELDTVNLSIRKCAHFAEYFVFYFLVYRGVSGGRLAWRWSWGLTAWLIAAAYSVVDELHQSFVASRTASPWDSLLDSTGSLVAMFVAFLLFRFFLHNLEKKHGSLISN